MNHPIPRPVKVMTVLCMLNLAGMAISCSSESTAPTELVSTDLTVGGGKEALAGKSVSVHYTGWLYDSSQERNRGERFDSSKDRGLPFTFTIGRGVIEGWSRGVPGMKEGGVRELVIPPDLAYGASGSPGGQVPPNATLVFEIEMIVARP